MANRNGKQLLHVRSNQSNTEGNGPKLPSASDIDYGEIAINYLKDNEKISIKNSNNEIVTFETEKQTQNKINVVSTSVVKVTESCGLDESLNYTPDVTNTLIKDTTNITEAVNKVANRINEIDEVTLEAFDTMNNSCGFNEEMTYIPQNELIQRTTSLAEAIEIVAKKANEISRIDISKLATKTELSDGLATKQNTLVSSTNIKTINGESLLGSGDLTIESDIIINVVQETGVSKSDVMSQKSVTDELNKFIDDISIENNVYGRKNGEWVQLNISFSTIMIDQTISDPSSMISGDVNGEVIQWIRRNSHRVLAKKTGDGTVTYIELDDNNSNKYFDGSEAKTDGTEGDVFVKLPTFYYRGTEGDKVEITFSKEPFEDCVKWDTNTLIGAYEATSGDHGLESRSGSNFHFGNQAVCKAEASKRGVGYQLVDWQMHCVMGCLFYAMYGSTDSQAICGKGTNDYTKFTGRTNSLGMTDTKADTNGNSGSINFWGLENWWGNRYEFMQENNIGTTMSTYDPITKGTRTIDVPNYQGDYVKRMVFGKYLDLIPSSDDPKDGSSSVGYCDHQYWNNTQSRSVYRSRAYNGVAGGVSYFEANYSSYYDESYTSRLAFRGVCTRAVTLEEFKSLLVQ